MIRGLEVFKNYFRDYSDQYVIIGVTGSDIADILKRVYRVI